MPEIKRVLDDDKGCHGVNGWNIADLYRLSCSRIWNAVSSSYPRLVDISRDSYIDPIIDYINPIDLCNKLNQVSTAGFCL